MPYISVSNVRIEEVTIERSNAEFSIVTLASGARICIRKNRIYNDKAALEKKLGLRSEPNRHRPPADYFH